MATATTTERLLYDRTSAAAAVGLSSRAIDYLISSGELDAVRIGRRVLVTADSLKKLASTGIERIRLAE